MTETLNLACSTGGEAAVEIVRYIVLGAVVCFLAWVFFK